MSSHRFPKINYDLYDMEIRIPWGIRTFGLFFVMSAIGQMIYISDYYRYYVTFRFLIEMPEAMVQLRYVGSWTLRIIALIIGIGIMCRRELFRKLALVLLLYCIASVGFRHIQPSLVFRVYFSVYEVILATLLFLYFSHPKIIRHFK